MRRNCGHLVVAKIGHDALSASCTAALNLLATAGSSARGVGGRANARADTDEGASRRPSSALFRLLAAAAAATLDAGGAPPVSRGLGRGARSRVALHLALRAANARVRAAPRSRGADAFVWLIATTCTTTSRRRVRRASRWSAAPTGAAARGRITMSGGAWRPVRPAEEPLPADAVRKHRGRGGRSAAQQRRRDARRGGRRRGRARSRARVRGARGDGRVRGGCAKRSCRGSLRPSTTTTSAATTAAARARSHPSAPIAQFLRFWRGGDGRGDRARRRAAAVHWQRRVRGVQQSQHAAAARAGCSG